MESTCTCTGGGERLRRAAQVLLQSRGGLPGPVRSWASPVQVVTRFNVPRTGEG